MIIRRVIVLSLALAAAVAASSQQMRLQVDPAKTTVKFTLDAALHTVHGTFRARPGTLQFDPSTGQVAGEFLVDATSGETGNGMRDRKMHKEVIESNSYPDISFHPERVEGIVASLGKSSVIVHGSFRIHGVDRHIDAPAQIEMFADHWTADVHFTVPYQKWGMKNPSTLFLRVSDSVEVEFVAGGSLVQHNAENRNPTQ